MGRTQAGFTLFEALVAMAVLGILVAVAMPAWMDAVARTRDAGIRAALVEAATRSTTHAVVANTRVVLCPSVSGEACISGTDWSEGWIAFADLDGNRERSGRETLVSSHGKLEGGSRLLGTAGRSRIVFQPRASNGGSNATFTLCTRRHASRASAFIIANSGRWRFATATPAAASVCAFGG